MVIVSAEKRELAFLADFLNDVYADRRSRKQLRMILRQPAFHRRSLLNTAIQQMQLRGEAIESIRALAYLKEEQIAERALAVLES